VVDLRAASREVGLGFEEILEIVDSIINRNVDGVNLIRIV
jgi:hypothetical protein